ncbi:MAG: 50S ribosomal protein L11 methyltransferase [Sphingobacteriaceae bacterium]
MSYQEVVFTQTGGVEAYRDVVIAELADLGFDTFEETEEGFKGYIPSSLYIETAILEVLDTYKAEAQFSFSHLAIKHENWNTLWESNFHPISVADKVYVRATFHEPEPRFAYEIVIDPKMAFGTGHHQTTASVMELILAEDFTGKKVLDMGCGTGILAILAKKMGAQTVDAIDYDPLCFESTLENTELNSMTNIQAILGGKDVIPNTTYEVILANINRNILLDQMERYAEVLAPNASLILSGFYEHPDLEIIKEAAHALGLRYVTHLVKQDWTAAKFIK